MQMMMLIVLTLTMTMKLDWRWRMRVLSWIFGMAYLVVMRTYLMLLFLPIVKE